MTFSQLFEVVRASGCSPEEFGQLIGISGMTLRRWLGKGKSLRVPKLYIPAIRETCFQLIAQGRLQAESPAVQTVLAHSYERQCEAALHNLGLSHDFSGANGSQDQMLMGLSQIGVQTDKQVRVEKGQKKIFSFKTLGEEWSARISQLWTVIHSSELTSMDKLIAYGALFYLLTPIDFIPDHIPFFGLLDDFGVLGVAVSYYNRTFSEIL